MDYTSDSNLGKTPPQGDLPGGAAAKTPCSQCRGHKKSKMLPDRKKKKKMQVAKQNIQNLVVKNLPANARDIRDLSLIPGW